MRRYKIVLEEKTEYLAVLEAENLLEAYNIAGDLNLNYAKLTNIAPITIVESCELEEGELKDEVIHGKYEDNEPWVKYKVQKDG